MSHAQKRTGASKVGVSTTSRKSVAAVSGTSKSRVGGQGATFASSRSNVFSSASGKKLAGSEGVRGTVPGKPYVQILDDLGQDVTPQPLLHLDPSAVKKSSNILGDGSAGTPTDLMSQASIYQAGTLNMSQSTYGGGPFGRSVFSADQSEQRSLGESMVGHVEEAHTSVTAWGDIKHKREEVKEVLNESDLAKVIDITLSETETIWILDMPGTCVSLESDEAAVVKEKNEKYKELCKSRAGNDRYMEREMNTFNDPPKLKLVQTQKIGYVDVGITAATWDMYDTYEELAAAQKKSEEGDEAGEENPEGTMSRPVSSKQKVETVEGDTQTDAPAGAVSRGQTQISIRPGTESRATIMSSVMMGSEAQGSTATGPTAEQKAKEEGEAIMKSDSLKKNLVIMERVVNLNSYQPRQASYRHFPIFEDIDRVKSESETPLPNQVAVSDAGPSLERLWVYSCPLTKGKNVSCMSWNKKNPDLIAIGYGQFEFTNQKGGMVCCWSLKNPEFPERIYTTEQGVTSLDFSNTHPNLLAVGMYDGTVAIYNVRSQNNEPVLDSFESNGKHIAPVWQLRWIEKERGSEERAEVLISVSTDGRVTQWSIRKGFECTDLMRLKRMASKAALVGLRGKEKKADSLITRTSGGACFDFNAKDTNIYLAGTEEGHIHKCSCSYNEQFLDTYTAHNGPVYKIQWSPFVPDVFVSCSGDWTMRLWHQEHLQPVLSCYSSTKSVFDVCWSPRSSTVFACVNEARVEIWDLSESTLDPIWSEASGQRLTTVTFAKNSESILVGDSDGKVTVYQLRGMPPPSDSGQKEALMSIIKTSLASQKQLKLDKPEEGEEEEEEEDEEELGDR
ncbi:WD repeat-containing protein 78-like [Lingula anatina]|uniref:Dynein axonemal intermediate chain 4 n=1 Tax=Lingula anatina TaxID=7574 RepID=A0A1S3JU20_LINAN|nr:WD repeat-containing protein 78-like [Lingula anatina]|eukprot:XP_013413827.1 WD repeat-containing protein 78-like [Lingula anatina]